MIRVVAFGEHILWSFAWNLCGPAVRNISDIREIHLHIIVTLVVEEKGFKSQTEILNYSLWAKTQYSWEIGQVVNKAGYSPILSISSHCRI